MVHYCWTKVATTPAIWLADACIFTERSKAVAFTWWGMATEWTFSMRCIHFGPLSWEKKTKKTKKHTTHEDSNLGQTILDPSSTSDLPAVWKHELCFWQVTITGFFLWLYITVTSGFFSHRISLQGYNYFYLYMREVRFQIWPFLVLFFPSFVALLVPLW